MDYSGKHALITGGSSGIGYALAKRLAAAGAHIWLLARNPDRLEKACQGLESYRVSPDQHIGGLIADVSNFQQVNNVIANHLEQYSAPDLIINCAGEALPGKFADLDLEVFHSMMAINYFGTLHVLKAALPGMIARGSGHVVNICSVVGFLGVYGYSAYGPSKFAVRGLSDSLRGELAENGIGISVVFPSDTQTPQLEFETPFRPPVLRELEKDNKIYSPDAVAGAILAGVSRGRYIITPGFDTSLYFMLTNFFGLVYPVMDLMIAQARRTIKRSQNSRAAKDNHTH